MSISRRFALVSAVTATGSGVAYASYAIHTQSEPIHPTISSYIPRSFLGSAAALAASTPIPTQLRPAAFRSFCSTVGCDTSQISNLSQFRSISAFMSRTPISSSLSSGDNNAPLVSPCEGVVEAVGSAKAFASISIKGCIHTAREILAAPAMDPLTSSAVHVTSSGAEQADDTSLWYIVIRLRARDAHSFFSPCDWKLISRRLVPGGLVCPASSTSDKYPKNERVALVGSWEYGLFSLTAVGAAARRTIALTSTDKKRDKKSSQILRAVSKSKEYTRPVNISKGDAVGAFQSGSAIVLIFEAPEAGFHQLVKEGDEVSLGQPLANLDYKAKKKKVTTTPKNDRSPSSRLQFRRAW